MSIRSKSREKRRAEVLSDPNDRAHGTTTGYDYGCRCERCSEAKRKAKHERYQSTVEARRKRLEELIAARNEPKPEPEPPEPPKPSKPNPVRVAKHEAAVAAKAARVKKDVCTVSELDKAMMGKPSVKAEHCLVCGRTWPLEQHHVVFRSAGEWVRNGHEVAKPTVTLCGFGNNLKDANGRYLCHGLAHHRRLHFRWVEGDYFAEGHWEYLVTKHPTKYQNALSMPGWERLGGA